MHPWNEPILDSVRKRLARLPHALLIHGVRGVGKLALAERIVQLLLCETEDAAKRPCGACSGCRWYLAGTHPDFRRIEPEALAKELPPSEEVPEKETQAKRGKPSIEIKVDQIRGLADFLNVGSHRGKLRVALVHPAEDMNEVSANALLKGLEEPPNGAVFILVSHRPAQLLPTIRSRCVALPVAMPVREVAQRWLESQEVENAARWLAYAGGAPLRALDYAADAATFERLLKAPAAVDDRDDLEPLVDALQKIALDRALSAFGLPPKYGASIAKTKDGLAWLTYARRLGEERLLCRHPLSPRLFSGDLLAAMPKS
ncbi:MAG: polymerase subunit delta [Betaproteobacteria bacterium]|jgi:DNA polymerase-3 subunit delta'|nr:polymerase subunit delta [Betaproteobacteria bacterium]